MSEPFSRQFSSALRTFFGIARLRSGPEDLPVSAPLLVLTIVLAIVPDVVRIVIAPSAEDLPVVLILVLEVAITLLWYGAVLKIARRPERFLQTMTAIFGFQIILAPAVLLTTWLFQAYAQDASWQLPAGMAGFALVIWVATIMVRILRSATGWPAFACIVLFLGQQLLTMRVAASLLPPVAAAPAAPAAAAP